MTTTNFPNGLSVPSGHVGSVAPIVTATGLRMAAGSAVLSNAGTVDVTTGLATVLYAQATPAGALSSTAGTVAGFSAVTCTPKASGVLLLKGYDQMGTASAVIGTAFWFAVGTQMGSLADKYEARFPGAVSDEGQKQERAERLVRKGESFPRSRMSTRSIVVPALPLDENGRLKP